MVEIAADGILEGLLVDAPIPLVGTTEGTMLGTELGRIEVVAEGFDKGTALPQPLEGDELGLLLSAAEGSTVGDEEDP